MVTGRLGMIRELILVIGRLDYGMSMMIESYMYRAN